MSQPISKEVLKRIEGELNSLKRERKRIAERLKKSASFGDLAENAEYQQAREEKEWLERKILGFEQKLKNTKVQNKTNFGGKVGFYSKVKIENNKKEFNLILVSPEEIDFSRGKISYESPLGKELLDKKKGDKIEVETPQGKEIYKIINVI